MIFRNKSDQLLFKGPFFAINKIKIAFRRIKTVFCHFRCTIGNDWCGRSIFVSDPTKKHVYRALLYSWRAYLLC